MTSKLHVVPHDDRWAVKREGNERSSTTHDTQKEAIDSARNLAKNGDRIVVHGSDGTIRDTISYSNGATENTDSDGSSTVSRTAKGKDVHTHDVVSVGSRVSWSAVIAGVVVAFSVYVGLAIFSIALGVTTIDEMQSRTFAYSATVITVFNLLVALFLGGFVVSRLTVGENKLESIVYGVLLWGTLSTILIITGAASGIGVGMVMAQSDTNANQSLSSSKISETLNLSKEQMAKYRQVANRSTQMTQQVGPVTFAWIGFGAMALSVLAAIGGAVCGAGPSLVMEQWRNRRMAVVKTA